MSFMVYLIIAALLVISYLLITSPTPADRHRQRLRQFSRLRAEADRERQRITTTMRERMNKVRREAEQHHRGQ